MRNSMRRVRVRVCTYEKTAKLQYRVMYSSLPVRKVQYQYTPLSTTGSRVRILYIEVGGGGGYGTPRGERGGPHMD